MSVQPLDIEFSKYWSRLTPVQKQSLLGVIKSFVEDESLITVTVEEYNKELREGEAQYEKGDYISQEEMLKHIEK